jgi:hypothetical protein
MPFTREQKREYYHNNAEYRAAVNATATECTRRRRMDPVLREIERQRDRERYLRRKAQAATMAAELTGKSLESSGLVAKVK